MSVKPLQVIDSKEDKDLHPSETLNVRAAIQELSTQRGELVRVIGSDTNIRVWIDETSGRAQPASERLEGVKALTFDVFGTVVDWRSSIIQEGEQLTTRTGIEVDWPRFADAWRAGYGPAMQRVRNGELVGLQFNNSK